MSDYKGLDQMRALMKHAKLPTPLSQRSQRDFPGTGFKHRAMRRLISKAQKIQASGDKMLSVVRTTASGAKKELLGIYNMPNPNSPMNRLIRSMGSTGATKGRNKPRKGGK